MAVALNSRIEWVTPRLGRQHTPLLEAQTSFIDSLLQNTGKHH